MSYMNYMNYMNYMSYMNKMNYMNYMNYMHSFYCFYKKKHLIIFLLFACRVLNIQFLIIFVQLIFEICFSLAILLAPVYLGSNMKSPVRFLAPVFSRVPPKETFHIVLYMYIILYSSALEQSSKLRVALLELCKPQTPGRLKR